MRVLMAALALVFAGACGGGEHDRLHLLVTSGFTDQIFVVDARDGRLVDSVSVDRRPGDRDEPHAVAVAPDGRHWYATVSHGEPTLWKFDARDHRLVGRLALPLRGAGRVRISPDGSLAAVPDYWRAGGAAAGEVALVATHDLTIKGVVQVCGVPHDAAFSPDGRHLAVACSASGDVAFVDVPGLGVVERVSLAPAGAAHARPARPMNVAWSGDGERLYVTLMGADVVAELPKPSAPGAVRYHPGTAAPTQIETSGGLLVVADRSRNTVSLLDPEAGEVVTAPVPGDHPHGVAVAAGGGTAFVTWEGDPRTPGGVLALDVETGRVLWSRPLGIYTLGVAVLSR